MSGVSVATIKDPEFINLQPLDINPLMSACEIKVLYIGKNRNHSYISKEVATEMSKTLRGAPIVGWYKKDKEDFLDHGNEITINGEGIDFKVKTRPYGFVAPDAKVWFQEFEDTDDFGNKTVREYLMTTGYLWTEQYEESKLAIEEGRPHSMELDGKTLDGKWSEDSSSGIEFFIINDAIFSKLCILGEDVEPCFEGSSITAPQVSKEFTKTDDFQQTLYKMMKELNYALQKGGKEMTTQEEVKVEEIKKDFSVDNAEKPVDTSFDTDKKEEKTDHKKEDDEQKEDKKDEEKDEEKDSPKPPADEEDDKEEKKKEKAQNTLSGDKYTILEQQYAQLKKDYESLVSFKQEIEKEKKIAMIDSFYMLSDEDKKDVVDNIDKYSLDEIESKLSVICVRKKVNFNLEDSKEKEESKEDVITYSLNDEIDNTPAWISAVRNNKRERQ